MLTRTLLLTIGVSLICAPTQAKNLVVEQMDAQEAQAGIKKCQYPLRGNFAPLVEAAARALTVEQIEKYMAMVQRGDVMIHVHADDALYALEILRDITSAKNGVKRDQVIVPTPEDYQLIIDSLALRLKERVLLTLLDDFINPANDQSLRYHVDQFVLFMQRPDNTEEPGYDKLLEALNGIRDVSELARGKEIADKVVGAIKTLPAHVQKMIDQVWSQRNDKERLSALNKRIKNNKRK